MKRNLCALLGLTLISTASPGTLRAALTNLPAAADTFILSGAPENNAGQHTWFDAGTDGTGNVRRGLIRFDLSVLPPGSTITSAVLQLTMTKVPFAGPVNSDMELRRLITGWNEGTQTGNSGSVGAPGEVTWNARMKATQPWTSPGAGSDAISTPSASTTVGSVALTDYTWTGSEVIDDVQFWVDNPSLNAGWLMTSSAEASLRSVRGFAARENGANAGVLEVGFIPPPPPAAATFTGISLTNAVFTTPPLIITNGRVQLAWLGETNSKFDLYYATSLLGPTNWNLAQANIPSAGSGTNLFTDPPYLAGSAFPPNTNVFYRLDSLPPAGPGLAVRLQVVATNFVSPTVLTHAGDGSGRLFVADQIGHIRIVDDLGTLLTAPFLDISNRMVVLQPNYDERGLLGLAFHPGYTTNGRFFVYYAAPPTGAPFNNKTVLSEFTVSQSDTNLADPASERVLLTIDQPQSNHEGAALVFGPDGFLYIGTGDGGGAGDQHGPFGNAQVLTNLLGKMLCVDVDGNNSANGQYGIPLDNPFISTPGAMPEIYAYGFRNPWRFSFDRGGNQECFVADVGQNVWEEVNILRKGGNYGWRIMEAHHGFDLALANTLSVSIPALDFPIFEYPHGPLGISIIGGFVYRGSAYPDLVGKYVFGDFSTGFGVADGAIYYLQETRPGIWERFTFQLYPTGGRLGRYVKGFGEDEAGEIYLLSTTNLGPSGRSGDIRRLVRP